MIFDPSTNQIVLSVQALCNMACKSGNIDSRYPRRAVGTSDMGNTHTDDTQTDDLPESKDGYYAHVMLRHACRVGDLPFYVWGYADGITQDGQGDFVVETKKRITNPHRVTKNLTAMEMAELCTYGYFLCASRNLRRVILRVVYVSVGLEGEQPMGGSERTYPMSAGELKDIFYSLLGKIYDTAKDFYDHQTRVREQAKSAVFPYKTMRQAQEDMIRECLRDMRHGETVFAEAPTGIGKTISTLYPAVRCFGERKCDKIFYLTAKASTRREAVGAVEKLIRAGTHIRGVVLSSKEAMCVCPLREGGHGGSKFCNPDACPYAKGYYDKVDSVIHQMLQSGVGVFTYAYIKETAKEAGVCPYELSLDLSDRCEVVICDYNYVFSPTVYLKRYFAEGIPKTTGHEYIFLVDEAHNLADRAREMYSGGLSLGVLKAYQDILSDFEATNEAETRGMIFPEEDSEHPPKKATLHAKDMDDLLGEISRMARVCHDNMIEGSDGVKRGAELTGQLPDVLSATACDLMMRCQSFMRQNQTHPLYDMVDNMASYLKSYVVSADHYDRHFATLVEVEGEDVAVTLTCLDPSSMLSPKLRWARSSIFFSATLTPADYFADILGGGKNSVCVSFDSPFPPENLCVVVGNHISTRFEDREKSYRAVVSYIAATVSAKRGNYMVFFPSYQYMTRVQELFAKKYPKIPLMVQKNTMSMEEKEGFIKAFTHQTDKLQIGFCVLGGSFSEGLDLPGDALIGTVIVGVGIPGLSSQRNIIKAYYDEAKDGEGYAYAYTYPGMNHVLQAAGRVIRRHEDRGVVVLLDDRYAAPPYLGLYPEHWGNPRVASDPMTLSNTLKRFWSKFAQE